MPRKPRPKKNKIQWSTKKKVALEKEEQGTIKNKLKSFWPLRKKKKEGVKNNG